MAHRLLLCALGRRQQDDRDHVGNKRLDMAGPLVASLFRLLFKKLTGEMRSYCDRVIERGADFSVEKAIRLQTISDGLKYSLATGNWGENTKVNIVYKQKVRNEGVIKKTSYSATGTRGGRGCQPGVEPLDVCVDTVTLASSQLAH